MIPQECCFDRRHELSLWRVHQAQQLSRRQTNMKLFRYGRSGQEKPGVVLPDGRHVDVSGFTKDYHEDFLGNNGATRLEKWLRQNLGHCPDVPPSFRYGPCVPRPSKIICIGLNYSRHAAEAGMERPKEPVIFLKAPTALSGPN